MVVRGNSEVCVVNDYQAAVTLAERLARGEKYQEAK